MRSKPVFLIHSAQVLFFLNTAIWAAFSIFNIFRVLNRSPEQAGTAWIIAILMFGNAAAMLVSGILIARPGWFGYYFALAVLAVNILLTITDQIGALDLITLFIDLVLVALLIAARRKHISASVP